MAKPLPRRSSDSDSPPSRDLPDHHPAAIIEDLVNGVCRRPPRLCAAAKLLLYISSTGRLVRPEVDPEFSSLATRFDLSPANLLRFARENHTELDEAFTAVSALAHDLGIDHIGGTSFKRASAPRASKNDPGASILQEALQLLEAETAALPRLMGDLPPGLQDRGARVKRIAQIANQQQDASTPAAVPAKIPRHMVTEDEGLIPPPRPLWCSPLSDRVLTILFAVFLLTPLLGYFRGWKGTASLDEKRNLAPAPVFGTDPAAAWPAKLEAYYDDRFGLRAYLVRSYNLLIHKYLKASNGDAVIGKDGWIFYARENIFKDFFGKAPLSEDELRRWKEYLENRQAMLARNHSRYLFVIAPDKNTIYPEKLPDYVREHRGRSRWMQLKEYLRQTDSSAEILDLHEPLIKAKSQGTLYFPQDTHWNGRGYLIAYQAMCAALASWFPEIHPQLLDTDYALRSESWSGGEWSLFGLSEENLTYQSEFLTPLGTQRARKEMAPFPAGVPPPPAYWQAPLYWEGKGRHSLLVFHDSYMRAGVQDREQVPLAEHFARTLLVGMQPSEYELALIADMFHPDIVIEERAERYLSDVPASLMDPSQCSQAEIVVGTQRTTPVQAVNATVEQQLSGMIVSALNNGSHFYLPDLPHPIEGVSIQITTPAAVTFAAYAIADDGGQWANRPLRVRLHAGLNAISLRLPRGATRVRIDPGDMKLTYTIHQVRYLSGCK